CRPQKPVSLQLLAVAPAERQERTTLAASVGAERGTGRLPRKSNARFRRRARYFVAPRILFCSAATSSSACLAFFFCCTTFCTSFVIILFICTALGIPRNGERALANC